MGAIELEVLSPAGSLLHEMGLDEVVLRRREPDHDPGSEVAILRHHAPELIATCAHELRYRRGERVSTLPVGAGVAEVLDERVTVLVTGTAAAAL
jgi:F0F1-type ATP synthase epsilon subunit